MRRVPDLTAHIATLEGFPIPVPYRTIILPEQGLEITLFDWASRTFPC